MKDTKKILRTAIYNALNGNVSYNAANIPVYDERQPSGSTNTRFIILTNQSEANVENNDSVWITDSSIDIEIYDKEASELSKDVVDSIYEAVMLILMPTTTTIGITVPAGFQFQNARRESSSHQPLTVSETQSIIIERVKLVFTIIEK